MIPLCVQSNLNSVTFNLWLGHSTLSNWSKITRAIASANQMQNLNPSHVSHSHFSTLQLVRLLLLRDLISLLLYFRFFLFGRCHFFNGFGPSILNQNVLYLSQTRFRNDSKRGGSNNITKTSRYPRQRATSMHMRVVVSGGHQILVPKATYVMQTVDTGI